MTQIYSNDFVKIIKDKNKSIFRIEFDYPNELLIKSLIKTRIIQGATVTDDYKSIQFKALSLKSLQQYQQEQNDIRGTRKLSITDVTLLLANLASQLKYLIAVGNHTIMGYNTKNIIVINDVKFAFLGIDMLAEIVNDRILISYPFSKRDFFLSPELLHIKEIPSYIHYKTCYFSLACLAIYGLLAEDDFYMEYLNDANVNKIVHYLNLHPIKNTKTYWLLSRCLVEAAENRSILFI